MSSPDAPVPAPAATATADEIVDATIEPASAADQAAHARLSELTAVLGDAILDTHVERGLAWARVAPENWRAAALACRDRLGLDYFDFLSAIDWLPDQQPNPDPDARSEPSKEIVTGVAGGSSRFQLLAHLYSTSSHGGVMLKADLDDADPRAETLVGVYRGANWHERECWEMFGITFLGHPDLVHLYLPWDFEGFPLRKDFPLLAREVKPWPGLVDVEPMPGESGEGQEEGGE